ncbi:MAG: hypothetical protein HC816_03820 [Leptolyngbyaceae cyanobacterium RM1_1_2]|nr:hypothetical protein [Leptolyngbyaceae cyanobacterium RM1_1_2]
MLGSFFTPQHLTQPPDQDAPQPPFIPVSMDHILTLVGQHLSPGDGDAVLRSAAAYSSYTPHGSFLSNSKVFFKPFASARYPLHPDSPSSGSFSTFLTQSGDYSPPVRAWFQGVEQLMIQAKLLNAIELAPGVDATALLKERSILLADENFLELDQSLLSDRVGLSGMLSQASNVGESSFQRWSSVAEVQVVEVAAKLADEAQSQQLALLKQCSNWHPTSLSESGKARIVHQVWVKDRLVGTLQNQAFAHQLANKLRRLLQEQVLHPEALKLTQVRGLPAAQIGNEILFVADDLVIEGSAGEQQWLTINWIDQLRLALGGAPLDLGSIQTFYRV